MSAQSWASSAQIRVMRARAGRVLPKSTQVDTIGPVLVSIGKTLANVGCIRPNVAEVWRSWPKLAQFKGSWPEPEQSQPSQLRPESNQRINARRQSPLP